MKINTANKKSFVSVLIPVFNGAQFLEETVQSVQQSTYQRYEILLIDDGSTDKSKAICKKLQKQYQNVRFYDFLRNRGLGRVLNFALKKARGAYICRINQDDTMSRDRIAKQLRFLERHPDVVLVGSWIKVENDNGSKHINIFLKDDAEIRKTWLKLSPCWDASVMYRREAGLAVGGYDQKYWPADDLHMWYKLGRIGKIANIQRPLVTIKFHSAAASIKHHKKHLLATYLVHRWAHEFVEEASVPTQFFWLGELAAGYLFPSRFNWYIYRFVKTIVFTARNFIPMPIPKRSATGVYSSYAWTSP